MNFPIALLRSVPPHHLHSRHYMICSGFSAKCATSLKGAELRAFALANSLGVNMLCNDGYLDS